MPLFGSGPAEQLARSPADAHRTPVWLGSNGRESPAADAPLPSANESSTAADEVHASGNSSRATGGAWARRVGSGSARNPRCSSIFLATSGSSMQAMSRIGPRQREHFRTSTPKTRFSNKVQSRRYVDGTDVDFGDAAGDDGGGNVGDTCGAAGGSAPSLVDAGRGKTLLRRRLVGAKTPCGALIHHLAVMNRERFAYVGGIRGTSFSSNSTPVITSCLRPSAERAFHVVCEAPVEQLAQARRSRRRRSRSRSAPTRVPTVLSFFCHT